MKTFGLVGSCAAVWASRLVPLTRLSRMAFLVASVQRTSMVFPPGAPPRPRHPDARNPAPQPRDPRRFRLLIPWACAVPGSAQCHQRIAGARSRHGRSSPRLLKSQCAREPHRGIRSQVATGPATTRNRGWALGCPRRKVRYRDQSRTRSLASRCSHSYLTWPWVTGTRARIREA